MEKMTKNRMAERTEAHHWLSIIDMSNIFRNFAIEMRENSLYDKKRIEPHRLRELILEDLKLYGPTSIKDINVRIGEEIPRRTLSRAIKDLVDSGHILSIGYGKTLRYELSRQTESNKA